MKGKFMIIAALLGALTFGACVDSTESASVTAIRNAKAEQLKSLATLNNAKAQAEATLAAAQAQLAAAEAQLLAAEAAAINAATEEQKIANQIAAAQAAKKIAKIEADMELAALEYQMDLLEAKLAFNESLEDLAEDEALALSTAYTSYTTALTNLADKQKALADKQKAIADEKAKLAKVDTLEEAIDAVNKNITDQTAKVNKVQAKIDAKKAAIAKLETISHSYDQLVNVEIPAADEALAKAQKAEYYALGAKNLAAAAVTELDADEAEELYAAYFDYISRYSTLKFTNIDVNDAFENEVGSKNDSYAFYLTTLNNSGVYVNGNDKNTAVVLFDNAISVNVYDEEDVYETDPLYQQRVLYYGIHEDAIATYEAELAKMLSTSSAATALAKATAEYEAYMETQDALAVMDIYNSYLESVESVKAEIAEALAQIKALTYQKSILTAANVDKYYDDDIKDLNDEIADLNKEIEKHEDAIDDLKDDVKADLEDYAANTQTKVDNLIDHVEDLIADIEEAQEDYTEVAAELASEVAILNAMASISEEWTATYVTEYNAAVAAENEAAAAYADAQAATVEAAELVEDLAELQAEMAALGATEDEYIVNEMLNTLYAELATLQDCATAGDDKLKGLKQEKATLKGYTDTLAALQNADADKAAAALAAYVKTMTENIATWEAQLPDLELQVAIAETSVVSYKAALDALLAE